MGAVAAEPAGTSEAAPQNNNASTLAVAVKAEGSVAAEDEEAEEPGTPGNAGVKGKRRRAAPDAGADAAAAKRARGGCVTYLPRLV